MKPILLAAFSASVTLLPAQTPVPPAETLPAVPAPSSAPAGTVTVTEAPVVLQASGILIRPLLAGPFHRVRELVPTDGYLAHFTVDSDFGSWQVTGARELGTCIREIHAIARLNALSRSDLFADGLKRSLEQPVDAAKNVLTHPVETVKALPGTVGHFLRKVGHTVSQAGASIREHAERREEGAASGFDPQELGRAAARAGKGIIGFETARLECARLLGVDPYTDNARLREEIDKVSWVFFAGGLPLRATALATGADTALSVTRFVGLPEEVYALTPDELALGNQEALKSMGAAPETLRAFSSNPALTPSLGRSIVRSLESLSGAAGRATAAGLAAECSTREQARFLAQAIAILAIRQSAGKVPEIREIRIIGRLPCAVDAIGTLLLPLPSDYVSWTPEAAAFVAREDLAGQRIHLIHTGDLSPLTRAGVERAGWTTTQL